MSTKNEQNEEKVKNDSRQVDRYTPEMETSIWYS